MNRFHAELSLMPLIRTFVCLIVLAAAAAPIHAHPVSYCDAWAQVQDGVIEVRLNVFLDDVVRFHISEEPVERIPTVRLQDAIAAHGPLLTKLLRIYNASGEALAGEVSLEPEWRTGSDFVDVAADSNLKLT